MQISLHIFTQGNLVFVMVVIAMFRYFYNHCEALRTYEVRGSVRDFVEQFRYV